VDGTIYFDREKDAEMRKKNQVERSRIVQKLAALKRTAAGGAGGGGNFQRARPRYEIVNTCSDHNHNTGLLTIDADEIEDNK